MPRQATVSTGQTDPDRLRRLRLLNRVGCIGLPLVILLVLLVGWWTGGRWSERRLQQEIARLESAGVLLPPDDLIPHVPEGERNAADLYARAFLIHNFPPEEQSAIHDLETGGPQWLARVHEVVEQNRGYYELLDEATRTPACAFPVNWADPYASTPHFANYAKLREAARMLALRAELLAAAGDYDGALESCATAVRLAEHVKLEPSIIGQLVAYAIQQIALGRLNEVLQWGTPTPEACRRLFDQIGSIDQIGPSVRAVQGELTLEGMAIFAMTRAGDAKALAPMLDLPDAAIAAYASYGRPLLIADQTTYLHHMEKRIAAYARPAVAAGDLLEEAHAILEEAPGYRSVITQQLAFPGPSIGLRTRDEIAAHLGAIQIALALKVFQRDHDRYPDTLAELAVEGWSLPKDPFAVPEADYRYRREGGGFVVWSLGPDLANDFGVSQQDRLRAPPTKEARGRALRTVDYDIVVRCPN